MIPEVPGALQTHQEIGYLHQRARCPRTDGYFLRNKVCPDRRCFPTGTFADVAVQTLGEAAVHRHGPAELRAAHTGATGPLEEFAAHSASHLRHTALRAHQPQKTLFCETLGARYSDFQWLHFHRRAVDGNKLLLLCKCNCTLGNCLCGSPKDAGIASV